ncbi:MAG: asparagine synthase (glutamine-hydrolyzing) [Candidatus Glassbacteria bacterium]|nr:asparagine synthase (glutamine-hydrolyzing) [Candidatus Glassbacteria bacterium]
MCGVAGIVDSLGAPVEEGLLRSMAGRMVHRGPDDEGYYRNGRAAGKGTGRVSAGLAFRRLSIIDLEGGHQPLDNESGSCWLVFNGEVYNFRQLREELEKLGHRFKTRTDSETILHAYESFGFRGMVERLRGMFAFALWDEERESLFLARDRLGQKPLVYYLGDGRLEFASELAALLEDRRIVREIDWQAVYHYLTFMCVPAPLTAFKGIRKLPPAHYLEYRNGEVSLERYWKLEYLPKLRLSHDEACEQLRRNLLEAVSLRLISDVPLGAFLSGGIDSSSVVAAMSRAGSGKVKTFSIGFDEEKFNELPFARQVAAHYATEHQEFMVRPQALEVLPMLVEHYGEPYADSSAIPTYYLSRMTRGHVTVALNGDGGDESFTGYRRHFANRLADRYQRMPAVLQKSVKATLRGLCPPGADRADLRARIYRFAEAAELERPRRYLRWVGFFSEEDKRGLLTDRVAAEIGTADSHSFMEELFAQGAGLDGADSGLLADANFYLPNDLLVKVDIATMAVSLEGRSPFLDHKMMEFAARLPSAYKLRGPRLKAILKDAVAGWLPRSVLKKPKWGFAVPIGQWFRGEMRDFLCDHLLGGSARGRDFFRPDRVETLVQMHLDGRRDLAHHLWILLMFELWQRTFFD